MRIVTNNVPRYTVTGFALTAKEKAEFDYLDDVDSGVFFRFKGQVYDIGEFCRVIPQGSKRCHPAECDNPEFAGWHGYMSDSFFSGILIKFPENDMDSVIIGTYYA